jgi:hypothetical protein
VFLKNDLALLEMSLVQFAMSEAMKSGFEILTTPDMVKVCFCFCFCCCCFCECCFFYSLCRNLCCMLVDFVRGTTRFHSFSTLFLNEFFKRSDTNNQIYKLANNPFALVGTSEAAIAGMNANTILRNLPHKYCGYSHCFRREVLFLVVVCCFVVCCFFSFQLCI